MERRYQLWDKKSALFTPVGAPINADEWVSKYGWILNPKAIPVVGGGVMTGNFCGELSQMKRSCEQMGAEFSDDLTNEELLQAIEDFEDEMNKPDTTPSAEERTAAALEFLAMSNLPDEV